MYGDACEPRVVLGRYAESINNGLLLFACMNECVCLSSYSIPD